MLLSKTKKKLEKLQKINISLKQEYESKFLDSITNDRIDNYYHSIDSSQLVYHYYANRGGSYWYILDTPDYSTKWRNSFFEKKRLIIEPLEPVNYDRIPYLLEKGSSDNPFAGTYDKRTCNFIGYCDTIIKSKYGPMLRLCDPSGSYLFPPIKELNYKDAYSYYEKKQILMIKLSFIYGQKVPKIESFQALNYTLY